jgi:dTDP-4-dehydro-6-deoxy-alpha-D-glucopyranose 2,3-dehydratase
LRYLPDRYDTVVPGFPADGFLRSALSEDRGRATLAEFRDWFAARKRQQELAVARVPLAALDQWHFLDAPFRLAHRGGRFFTIEGLRVEAGFDVPATWDQPIICQPEVGILGLLAHSFDGIWHFLVQAKLEPGNVNGLQISPTVQATRSNFTRAHGGTSPTYLEYFRERGRARVLVDQLQSEQGSRFFRKQNRNMILEVEEEPPSDPRFFWLTLGQISRLLRDDNLVNMDARSILACIPLYDPSLKSRLRQDRSRDRFGAALLDSLEPNRAANSMDELLHWLTDLRSRFSARLERWPLNVLRNWRVDDDEIRHEEGRYFSVIGVDIRAADREVARWQQPLLEHHGRGINGFLLQRLDGVLHFLVRACFYPGNRELFELGSTVARSNAEMVFGTPEAPPFLDLFRDPPPERIRYRAIQSEEGGRFYHYQNQYVILELKEGQPLELPEAYRWMTLGQIQHLVRYGFFNVEGRNLLACLDLSMDPTDHGERAYRAPLVPVMSELSVPT